MVKVNTYKRPYGFYKTDYTDNFGDELEKMAENLDISYEEIAGVAFWSIKRKDQEDEDEKIRSFTNHEDGDKILKEMIKEMSSFFKCLHTFLNQPKENNT